MPSTLTARWSLLVLTSVLASACGNKGDLFLPTTLDDERRLRRIDAGLPDPVTPGEPLPRSSSTGAMPLDPGDPGDPGDLAVPIGPTGLDGHPDEGAGNVRVPDAAGERRGAGS